MPSSPTPTIAILLPCFNEEATIGKVVRDFRAAVPKADIYVYDNNSTDHTAQIAQDEGAIVRHEPRQGKGNVIRAMFQDIDADVYVMADGDDTYPADEAPKMINGVLDGFDMVIGDRLSSTYFTENKRRFHNMGNRLVRHSINSLFGSNIKDIMTGYRAFSFTFAKTFPLLSKCFEVETEMTVHSLDNNLKIREVPIAYRDRPEGSVSKLNTFGDGFRVLSTIFRLIRECKPLPFFGGTGLIISLTGLLLSISVAVEFWKTGWVSRFPTLIGATMLVVTGLLLMIAGILLDATAKNARKEFIIHVNQFAFLSRHIHQAHD